MQNIYHCTTKYFKKYNLLLKFTLIPVWPLTKGEVSSGRIECVFDTH